MRTLFGIGLFIVSLYASFASADYRDLYRDGKYTEALADLNQSTEATQGTYPYYFNRGIIHHALNQEALAVAYLSKAKSIDPSAEGLAIPLREANIQLVKWLGQHRLDATSTPVETLGEILPLDVFLVIFSGLSFLSWIGVFLVRSKRSVFMKAGFASLVLAALVGAWGFWLDQHPLFIVTNSRLVKSGPGESYLDRGAVELGMKLRVVGQMLEPGGAVGAAPVRWWKVRFNEKRDLGFLPEQSGLLLTDESNTPEG